MAVKKPVAFFVCQKLNGIGFHRHNIEHVFKGGFFSLPINYPKIEAMQVDRVAHHRIVVQCNAQYFAFFYGYFITLAQHFIIHTPNVAVHVSGKGKLQFLNRCCFRQGGSMR
ncbi:hypothetical protein D3C72_2103220 [compost metagenome]